MEGIDGGLHPADDAQGLCEVKKRHARNLISIPFIAYA